MAEDTEIYSGEKVDVYQPEHEGGNINKSYTKFYKAEQEAIPLAFSRGLSRRPYFSRSP